MIISTDIFTYFFLIFCGLYNGILFFSFIWFSVSLEAFENKKRTNPSIDKTDLPTITIMIPLLNEENVVENSIARLLGMPYEGKLEVLAVDDNSTDITPVILSRLSKNKSNFYYLQRNKPRAQIGKGDVLNQGYDYLRYRKFPDRDPDNWIIGVFDADGRPVEKDFFSRAGELFVDSEVSAAQCGVRIRNKSRLIASLQDVEFSTFSFITQMVRDNTSGAVALGGNGQFIRASSLDSVRADDRYWNNTALTEDLEIGTRILLSGGRIRFINRWVSQEGVETFRALFKQRIRWAWGALQVFISYVLGGKILRASIPTRRKIDLHYYLSFWIVPFVVIATLGLFLLDQINVITIANRFGLIFLLINSFSFIPLILMGLIWAGISWQRILYLAPVTIVYTYHWIPVLFVAFLKIITSRKPHWVKTERYEEYTGHEAYQPQGTKLGDILVDLGICSPDLISEALEQQSLGGHRELLGEILTDELGLTKSKLAYAMDVQQGLLRDSYPEEAFPINYNYIKI
ncbi:glycosyltransferase family 2 protein [Candidatus Bipolaricaulota bacterium]|nr:glycosyltransferase family 2 protein [Candidatus Bipolaricaulota bacterium]